MWDWQSIPTDPAELPLPKFFTLLNRRMKDLGLLLRTTASNTTITPIVDGTAIPSVVDRAKIYKTGNTVAVNLTGFAGGVPGQSIILLAGDGNTTLINSANLILKGGANVLLAAGNTKLFLTEDGVVWREYPAP